MKQTESNGTTMEQINRIELKGNVGSIYTTDTASGKMARVSLATNYLYRDPDGNTGVETTWLPVLVTERKGITAETIGQLKKGGYVHVIGRMRSARWTAVDGTERGGLEVFAQTVEILDDGEE